VDARQGKELFDLSDLNKAILLLLVAR